MLPELTQRPSLRLALLLLCASAVSAPAALGQQLRVQAAVEKQQVYLGEPFLFQIQVEGSDAPEEPDLREVADFTVQELGGQQNSSQSVTIVNGKIDRVVRKGYNFSYRLTPKKAGRLTIPSIEVSADGQTARTRPISVRAAAPSESEDFKLRLTLSEQKAYVGQPVTMTVTWYIGKDVRDFAFNVPVLDDQRFEIASVEVPIDPVQRDRYVQIPLAQGQIIGEKGRATLDDREFVTVRFRRVLIPKQKGRVVLPQATVSCKSLQGYRRNRPRSLFDDFFRDDFFGMGRNAVYESSVVPSNTPSLEVLDLPREGRPVGFSRLIGRYDITADAAPTELNVGDPITLSLRVSGPLFLEKVDLPPLNNQPALARDFKIPQERAAGAIRGETKVFTQTLRAKHSEVREIPSIELSYFDPVAARYSLARTEPIPLKVEGTRIITARDAEGLSGGGPIQTELESLEGGIVHNYEGFEALVNQENGPAAWLRSPVWTSLVFLPPLTYVGLWAFTFLARRQESDPAGRKARRAFKELSKNLRSLEHQAQNEPDQQDSALLEALRQYLGSRLSLPAGALTFADVRETLEERGVGRETVESLGKLFERCEAGRYAGGALAGQDSSATARTMLDVAQQLERRLG